MATEQDQRGASRLPVLITGLLLAVVFAIDINVPLGIADAVLYVVAVLISLSYPRAFFTVVVALTATVLTFIGYVVHPAAETPMWMVLVNRGLSVFAIWAAAVLGVQLRNKASRLHHSDVRMKAIVDTAVDAIITIDRRGIVQSFNRAAERMFGYTEDEVVGRNVRKLMPAPYRDEHDEYLRRYQETGERRIIGIGREVKGRRKDGSIFPIDLAVSEVNHLGMFTGIIRDISQRQEAEDQLRREHELSEGLVQTAQSIVLVLDSAGRIVRFNLYTEQLTGWSLDEVKGKDWIETFLPARDREEIRRRFDSAIGGTRTRGGLNTIVTRDGSERLIEWYDSPLTDEQGRQIGLLCIGQDITERRRAEEQLRQADRLSSIGTLAAGLGHDMNNVLLPMRSRLDLVDHEELTPKARTQLGEVRKLARYLQELADGLHLLALDPNDVEASTEATRLEEWWDQVHTLLGRALPKGVRFSTSLPFDLPEVPVPPHRLTQAVLNLLVNSGKAVGEDGRVRLWAEAADNGARVRLGVTDNGCGMTEEVRNRALEPFFTTKKRGLGTGLGLSLVHGVVQAAGGTISIQSEPNRGTTIVLNLPTVEPVVPADVSPPDESGAPRAAVSVRDSRVRSLVSNLLEMAGYQTVTSESPPSDDVRVWVVDAEPETDPGFHGSQNGTRHVIVLGGAAEAVERDNVRVVENPNDFGALRAAIESTVEGQRT